MKNKIATAILLLFFTTGNLLSQNLVPNYSFENETSCFLQNAGWAMPEINYAVSWEMPTMGTSDHYHPCHTGGFGQFDPPAVWSGYAYAQDGAAYAGLMTNQDNSGGYREYMQAPLTSPLIAGETYELGFYYKFAEQSQYATNGLGIRVQTGATNLPGSQTVLPGAAMVQTTTIQTDTANWTLLSGTYTAVGGEDYVLIGCWLPDGVLSNVLSGFGTSPVSYYYIDSVFVSLACTASITGQTNFCATDPATSIQAAVSGTWTGTGISNPSTGLFDPAISGIGSFEVINTVSTGLCSTADTITVTVSPSESATISYSSTNYCVYDNDPGATVQGTTGGIFSIDGGGVINSSTGQIDLDQTGGGTFVVSYVTPGTCSDSTAFTLTIGPSSSVTITPVNAMCENEGLLDLQPTSNGTWIGNGITNAALGMFDPAVAGVGIHTITHTISENGCTVVDSIDLEVIPEDNSDFSYPSQVYCLSDSDPVATVSGLSGGLFTIDNGGVMNTATGEVFLTACGVGTFEVTYTTNGACPTSSTFSLEIVTTPDASISQAGPLCETETPINLQAITAGGVLEWKWNYRPSTWNI